MIENMQSQYIERLKSFFQGYVDESGRHIYVEQIQKISLEGLLSLYVNYDDLLRFDPATAQELREDPETIIHDADEAFREVLKIEDPIFAEEHKNDLRVRFTNIPDQVDLRYLRSVHLGNLISVEGIIVRQSVVKPLLVQGVFQCLNCGETSLVHQELGLYTEPTQCPNANCGKKGPFKLLTDDPYTTYTDLQTVTIQERPENLPPGQIPRSLPARLVGDLVDKVRAGDRAIVSGIVRMKASFQGKKGRLATFNPWMEVNFVSSREKEFEEIEIDPETERRIIELSRDLNIHQKIIRSVAPSIYGMETIKEAIATVLFGGVSRVAPDGMKQRGESNLLIVGDPGVAKCVGPDTKVLLANGELKEIRNIVDSQLSINKTEIDDGYYAEGILPIMTLRPDGKIVEHYANIFWKRESPKNVYQITTKTGKKIHVTPTHPFFTIKQGKIASIRAQDLETGQFIATPRLIKIKGKEQLDIQIKPGRTNANKILIPNKMSNELARLLGYLCGDGYIQKNSSSNSILFTNADDGVLLDFKNIVKKTFGDISVYKRPKTEKNNISELYISSIEASRFLLKLAPSLSQGTHRKKVPSPILTGTDETIVNFLQGYFETDGYVSKTRNTISATTSSKKLASGIQYLLQRLGIVSQIDTSKISVYRNQEPNLYYRIKITSRKETERLFSLLKFRSFKTDLFDKRHHKDYNSNIDVVPNLQELFRNTRKELNLSQNKMGISRTTYQHYERGDRNLSMSKLQTIVKHLENTVMSSKSLSVEILKKHSTSDIFWDQVICIKKIKPKFDYVYDLQVPVTHNFIANGVVVHNSQLLQFTHRLAPRGIFTSGKASSAAGLCVSADSNVFLHEDIKPIAELVDREFESGSLKKYRKGFYYVENLNDEKKVLHSENLCAEATKINRYWKIKSPEKLMSVTVRSGRNIELTPQTPLLSVNDEGLVWIPAKFLKKGDRIATLKTLPVNKHKHPPSMVHFLKTYEGTIIVHNLEEIITEVITTFCNNENKTKREVSSLLNTNEDTLYQWMNKERRGTITFDQLENICELTNVTLNDILPDQITLEITQEKPFRVPKKLNGDWFYILGLIMGDGRVSLSKGKKSYGAVTIGLSNTEPHLLEIFADFVDGLGIKVSKTKGTDKKPTEYRLHSKFVFHVFQYFGLIPSPKANSITPNLEILYYERNILSNFLQGLFDSDGWISSQKDGYNRINFSSSSEKLIDFVQLALSVYGIIAFKRKRKEPKKYNSITITKSPRYQLEFSSYTSFQKFKEEISFKHPVKQRKLASCCTLDKKYHSNGDTIPFIRNWLREIFKFYNISTKKIVGTHNTFSKSNERSMSKEILYHILPKISPDFGDHKVSITNEQMKNIYSDLKITHTKAQLKDVLSLNENKFQHLFNNKTRPIDMRINVLQRFLEFEKISDFNRSLIENIIVEEEKKHYNQLYKIKLLKAMLNDDIFWDEIKRLTTIDSKNEYVYDLTIPQTHNFIVNGFVTHNTAAVVRDADTGEFTLEAGALVLGDRGIACLLPYSKVISNGKIVGIEQLFDENNKYIGKTDQEIIEITDIEIETPVLDDNLISKNAIGTKIRRKRYNGRILELTTDTGFKLHLTPDHKIIDGATLEWKEASELSLGDSLVAPLQLKNDTKDIFVLDILPDDWIVILSTEEKNKLRDHILRKYSSLAEFYRKYGIDKGVFSGKLALKISTFKSILSEFDLYTKWKRQPFKYGRIASGEKLKVSKITPEMAYYFGFLYCDGWVQDTGRSLSLAISQFESNMKQISQIKQMFNTFSNRKINSYERKIESNIKGQDVSSVNYHLKIGSNLLGTLYKHITRDDLSHILELKDEQLKAFLAGCIDADGCITTKTSKKIGKTYSTVHVDLLLSDSQNINENLLLALRRFDIYAKIGKTQNSKVDSIQITSRKDMTRLSKTICDYSVKSRTIESRKNKVSSNRDKLPQKVVAEICADIRKEFSTSILVEKGLWSTIYSYQKEKYLPSRGQLGKIKNRLPSLSNKVNGKIDMLLREDFFLEQIVDIKEKQYDGYVYDLYVPEYHNFLADGVIVHNCIDEFDKMNHLDRSSIHEAMEQQSYHPSFELTLSDKTSVCIGDFVDDLFFRYSSRKVDGINCEILDTDDLNLGIFTTDFSTTYRTNINRVSRHKAPNYFIRITYGNDQSILVTPEHPIFVSEEGKIITKAAEEISKGDLAPTVNEHLIEGEQYIDAMLPVKNVEIIMNEGKYKTDWVYDVTVEPTETFISHGLILHNTVSIAKAGIVAQLNARTAIVAAANPRFGRYEKNRPALENINLTPTILSRFDLLFVVKDEPAPDHDRKMARHILDLRRGQIGEYSDPPIDMTLLRKYISYAKQHVQPNLTDEAMKRIEDFYLGLRSQSDDKSLAITPRYLEAIIRLSEAQARMALKDDVTIDHVEAAIRLLNESLEQVGKDPITGRVDIDYIISGTTSASRSNMQVVMDIIKTQTKKGKSELVSIARIKELAKKEGIDDDFIDRLIVQLRQNGEVYLPKEGYVKLV